MTATVMYVYILILILIHPKGWRNWHLNSKVKNFHGIEKYVIQKIIFFNGFTNVKSGKDEKKKKKKSLAVTSSELDVWIEEYFILVTRIYFNLFRLSDS